LIDQARVITGSFSFTAAAQKSNAENLPLIEDLVPAAKYRGIGRAGGRHRPAMQSDAFAASSR